VATKKRKQCPSCGRAFIKGRMVHMLDGKALKRRTVCEPCERTAVRILIEPPIVFQGRKVPPKRLPALLRSPGDGP
jgi:NAD-dependent SIR2 family protein deacetylase